MRASTGGLGSVSISFDLTGALPPELGALNLLALDLSNNQLTGALPLELGALLNLRDFDLSDNQLTGSIPPELGNLSNLEYLYLSNNQLTGSIPQSVLDMLAVKALENPPYVETEISDQRVVVGDNFNLDISENFGDINNDISSYSASGLPPGLTLNPQGMLSGSPTTEGNFAVTVTASDSGRLEVEDYFEILVVEPAPLNANDYTALEALYESTGGTNWTNNSGWNNWDFSSETPPAASEADNWYGVTVTEDRVTELALENNQLTGSIPSNLGNLFNLENLDLSNNQLTGSIPQSVLDLSSSRNLENPPYVEIEISDQRVVVGDNFNLDISENFGDINNISSYSASGLPPGLTLDRQGVISGSPTTGGNFAVTVTASDSGRLEVEDPFEIVVDPVG